MTPFKRRERHHSTSALRVVEKNVPEERQSDGRESKRTKAIVYIVGTSTRTRGGIGYVIERYLESELAEDYRLLHIVTHCDGSKLKKLWLLLAGLVRFAWSILFVGSGVVHIHTSSGPSFLRKVLFVLTARLTACRVVYHIHAGNFRAYYDRSGGIVRRLVRAVLRSADAIIVLTRHWEREIRSLEPRCAQIYVLGNPVDVAKYKPAEKREQRPGYQLLFLGAIMKEKGVYDIIDCVGQLVHEGWDICVTFAGDREIERSREACLERGLKERARFVGWVDETRKLELLRDADALLLPSYAEGLPLCVLEAMACGVPVICSAVGGLPDLIRNEFNGLLIEAGDREQLRGAIRRLLGDAALRNRVASAARETVVGEYALEAVARSLKSIYDDVRRSKSGNDVGSGLRVDCIDEENPLK